jgi:hypothetical protein
VAADTFAEEQQAGVGIVQQKTVAGWLANKRDYSRLHGEKRIGFWYPMLLSRLYEGFH